MNIYNISYVERDDILQRLLTLATVDHSARSSAMGLSYCNKRRKLLGSALCPSHHSRLASFTKRRETTSVHRLRSSADICCRKSGMSEPMVPLWCSIAHAISISRISS